MKEICCVIVGGGYAGIHAAKAVHQALRKEAAGRKLRLVLIDKQPQHLRKVLLFKPAAEEASDIRIGWDRLLPEGAQFIQGTVKSIAREDRRLAYVDSEGRETTLAYDRLIVAVGSLVRQPEPEQGGIALSGTDAAARIRETWRAHMRQAARIADPAERRRQLAVAVAGAGISGMETSAELAFAMREEAARTGLDPADVTVYLLNAQSRLFSEGPAAVGRKLERALTGGGVTVLHGVKAVREAEGAVLLSDGRSLPAGLCVWTLGLVPNPALRSFGLPLAPTGQLQVDECYRVQGAEGVYSIGDCARVVDPSNGYADRMTCKEAIAQATRLGHVVAADLQGKPAPAHKRYMDFYCFGLGPERGMVWTRRWGLDLVIGGKLGWKLRKFTWDLASFVR